MNQEDKIPEIELKLETIEVKSQIRKIRLTRRNTFYIGVMGKMKCLYYWLKYCREKERVSFSRWLDEPVAYKVEMPNDTYYHHELCFDKEIEKELEHYLTDEVERKRKN